MQHAAFARLLGQLDVVAARLDAGERQALIGIEPGRYDVKLAEKSGKSCVLHDIEVKAGGPYAFSIGEDELKACQ